jgi:hypothetical protein
MAFAPGQVFYYTGKYGVQTDFYFSSNDPASTLGDLYNGTAWASGDATISKDGGAETGTTNTPAQITASGFIHKLTLSTTEMSASRILVTIRDQTASEVFGPVTLIVTVKLDLGALDIDANSGPSNRVAVNIQGNGTGQGIKIVAGGTGVGASVAGGGTSGDGMTIACTGASNNGLTVTGGNSGTVAGGVFQNAGAGNAVYLGMAGDGMRITQSAGGGCGLRVTGGGTNADGVIVTGLGAGDAIKITAGATGNAFEAIAGATSGVGIKVTTTSGDAMQLSPTAGHALTLTPNGTGKRGFEIAPVSSELFFLRKATAAAGAAGSITLDGSASAVDNYYNETMVVILAGTGLGQSRYISSYVGATKVATVTRNWTTTPDGTSVFMIIPGPDVWDCLEGSEPTTARGNNEAMRLILKRIVRWFFNKITETATTQSMYKDDSTTILASQSISDDGVTATKLKQV